MPLARPTSFVGELRKLPAFARRDLLVAWSYRGAFFGEWIGLLTGTLTFYFVGLMVDEKTLPSYGGSHTTYMEFVAAGIALSAFIQLGLGRVSAALRGEQLMGTLESLLITPTSVSTIQVGSAAYDLIYVPVRTALFFLILTLTFGLSFEPSGFAPAFLAMMLFIPFVWGLGVMSAAITLTFRQGGGAFALGVSALIVGSGAFFPLDLLPHWVTTVAQFNPVTLAVEGVRRPLLGGGWEGIWPRGLALAPVSVVTLAVGLYAFRLALRREQRRGTLGLY
ncbi:MAG: type transport system permease protein [Gaiellaceae bacterium]|jgi:ABC-2 type transport system permease protein|nr:type transport system permease protein [Gaiellaceae bacterium]